MLNFNLFLILLFFLTLNANETLSKKSSNYLKHLLNIKFSKIESQIRYLQQAEHQNVQSNFTTTTATTAQSFLVFRPKQVEPPNDEDYSEIDDYYDYINIQEDLPETYDKLPDYRATTTSPKWISTNSSALSKFNLKAIFDFVEIILRPTNPNENTVESAKKFAQISNEELAADTNENILDENTNETAADDK